MRPSPRRDSAGRTQLSLAAAVTTPRGTHDPVVLVRLAAPWAELDRPVLPLPHRLIRVTELRRAHEREQDPLDPPSAATPSPDPPARKALAHAVPPPALRRLIPGVASPCDRRYPASRAIAAGPETVPII